MAKEGAQRLYCRYGRRTEVSVVRARGRVGGRGIGEACLVGLTRGGRSFWFLVSVVEWRRKGGMKWLVLVW